MIPEVTERLKEAAKAGRITAHTAEALTKQGNTQRKHRQAQSEWSPATQPEWLTGEVLRRENPGQARRAFDLAYRVKARGLPLVRGAHPGALPPASSALGSAGSTRGFARTRS